MFEHGFAFVCGLTFELSGRQRQDARARTQTMYSVPAAGPWWPAVGAPLERGVRPRVRALRPGKSVPSLGELPIQRHSLQALVSCCTSRRLDLATRRQTFCEPDHPAQAWRSMAALDGDQLEGQRRRYSVSYSTFHANRLRSLGSSTAHTPSLASQVFHSSRCDQPYGRLCGPQADSRRVAISLRSRNGVAV
jgi:hypothetical protein